MGAKQFIKEHGVEKAREVIDGAPANARYFETYPLRVRYYISDIGCNRAISISELKRLVESVDLLKSNGGYEEAKDTFDFAIKHGMNDLTEFGSRLKQAIADYESIYSNDCEILDHPEDYTSPNCKKLDHLPKMHSHLTSETLKNDDEQVK